MKKTILFLSLVLTGLTAYAQQGFLRGKIIDAETGEALIGATVSVPGTDKGAVADFNGNYSLKLDPGTHSVLFQFVSYQPTTVSDIEIKADETTTMDISLSTDVTELEGVVITAEQARDTETALLTLQRKSANLMDGISSQTFRKVGDSDLGSAMKRVTGVSVQQGKYVYVRGLGDRYTRTTLNEMSIPGLDPDNNSVQIDLFPTSTVENVIVYKTFTPDLVGDFSGGIVNVETKEFPEEKATSFSVGLGFNPEMNFNDDFTLYKGGNLDYLGMDDGTRELPFDKNTNIPDEALDDPRLESITRSFGKTMAAQPRSTFFNSSLSFSHGNQVNKGNSTIGYNAVLNYKNEFTYFDNVFFGDFLKSNNSEVNQLQRFSQRSGVLGQQNVLWSALLSGALKFDNHNFSLSLLRSQNGQSQASDRVFSDFDQTGATLLQDILTYTQRSLTTGIIVGKHRLKGIDLEWRNVLTYSKIYDPDFRSTAISVSQGDTTLRVGDGAGINRFWRDLNEWNESFKVDLTVPYGESSKFKFGGIGTLKSRDFEVLSYNFRVTDPSNVSIDPDDFFREENIWTPEEEEGTYAIGNYQPANSFDSRMSVFGAYVMTEQQISDQLKAIYGVRVEKADMFYTGQNNQGTVFYDDEKTLDELDFMPSVNMVYNIIENMNLRMSYSRTLARPTFKEKSVAQIFDPISGRTFVGNIDLEQTHINNADIRWEYFYTPSEMVSVSGFYKHFNGHIELTSFDVRPDELKPRNAGESNIVGVELEVRKNLEFIAPTLTNLSVGTNASFVRSSVDLKSVIVNNNGTSDYELRQQFLRDGEELDDTRPMAGQSPFLINAYLNYVNEGGDLNINLAYNVQGETLNIVGSGRVPDVYTKPFNSLNLNAYKDFGVEGNSRVTVGITNILDDDQENVFKSYEAEEQYFSVFRPGRTFSVKYSYRF
ncbi:TonB-dependent receptor [Porifericola rhodea]|uniref:TonB-dependent receptor n=1 Tax=Porifericola rhodea TaxID=930972 RepID=UPI002665E820|nr:TonB-dependent receptor [Porifericola rhodea]WKN33627.1 TonB-dependent receptor [Porifericola rhodea]